MRKFVITAAIFLFVSTLLTCTALAAQPIIQADEQYLDISSGLYVLNGHVTVQAAGRTITAGTAKVDLTGMQVWGFNGITLRQDGVYFTGDSVYVSGTDHYARITGGVQLERNNLAITADTVEYNWKDKAALFSGHVRVQQNGRETTADCVRYNTVDGTWQVVN